jgi:CRP-like cAMP-binding protein
MAELKLKIEKYKPNSLIFIEGNQKTDNFYIIKNGNVQINRIHEFPDEQGKNVYGPGDTFGVVSCLSYRPHIDTAKTLNSVEVISVEREQFIPLIQNNTGIALKILRSFSKKLREFDTAITRMALKKPVDENILKVAEIGDYYFNRKKYKQAYYCYTRYKSLRPDDQNPKIIQNIRMMDSMKLDKVFYKDLDNFTRVYKEKSMLFCEHEPGNEVFIIQKGRVQISKIVKDQELLLAVLNPGDVIGEMAILENKPRNASAIAFEELQVLVLNKENFMNMVQNNPQVVYKILTLLSERIWVAYRQLENLAIKDDYKRLMDAIMIQLEKQKVPIEKNKDFNLGLSPHDLIKLVGISEGKEDELLERLVMDKNFKLVNNTIIVNDLEDFAKQVESIRKFQLNTQNK